MIFILTLGTAWDDGTANKATLKFFLIFLFLLLASSNSAGSSGGDETDLLTGRGASLDGRSLTDVLMVTTTVGMLDGVHGNTSNLGPAVPLNLESGKQLEC